MRLPEAMKNEIVERLKPLDLEMSMLFGSYANGEPNENSDIDLYIVTKDDLMPLSWKQKSNLRLKYSQQLLDFRVRYPMDLIVYTRPMHKKSIETNSSFQGR